MNLAQLQFPIFKPYNKPTIELYISGCKGKCSHCHNFELWDFNYGEPLTLKTIEKINKRREFFDAISILGGDLLDQKEFEARCLSKRLKESFKDKELWLFTGYNKDECPSWIWKYYDFVKVGRYFQHLATNDFPASSNQQLLIKGKDY